jgi:hypothetical protein
MNWLLGVIALLIALGIGFICYVFKDMDNDDDYNYYD